MKDEILQTSLRQFMKHGIRDMSIQKLVEPLGISTKTVYKYFKNKEDLLEEVLNLYHAQRYQNLENLSRNEKVVQLFFDIWYTGVEVAYKVNKAFFSDLYYYYPDLGSKIEASTSKKYQEKFVQIIRRGIDEDVFEKGIIPEVVLESVLVLYGAIIRKEKFKPFRIPSFDILLNTIAIYIRGFCTAKGILELDEYIRTYKTSGADIRAKKKMAAGNNIPIKDATVPV